MNRYLLWQLVRYGATGVVSVASYTGLLWLMVHFTSLHEVGANATAYSVATLLNYLLNFYWSFASNEPHTAASAKFATIVAAGVGLNTLFVTAATQSFHMPVLWAALAFASLWPALSFAAQKFWAFKA